MFVKSDLEEFIGEEVMIYYLCLGSQEDYDEAEVTITKVTDTAIQFTENKTNAAGIDYCDLVIMPLERVIEINIFSGTVE